MFYCDFPDLSVSYSTPYREEISSLDFNRPVLDFAVDDKSEELNCHRRLDSHPNLVNLLDSFETDAHLYLVLEFCARGDLYEAIRTGCGPLETEHVRDYYRTAKL